MEQQQFEIKVNRIAELLGKTAYDVKFRHSPQSLLATLTKGDEEIAISVGWASEKDRFHVKGFYPCAINGKWRYNLKPVSITMTEKKSSEQMAMEICRRLMPTYREQLAQAVEWVAKENAFIKVRTEGIKAIAEVAGVFPRFVNGKECNEGRVIFYRDSDTSCEVCPNGIGFFNMDLKGVSLEQAKQIIQILKSE